MKAKVIGIKQDRNAAKTHPQTPKQYAQTTKAAK